jgi:hypothetical protein
MASLWIGFVGPELERMKKSLATAWTKHGPFDRIVLLASGRGEERGSRALTRLTKKNKKIFRNSIEKDYRGVSIRTVDVDLFSFKKAFRDMNRLLSQEQNCKKIVIDPSVATKLAMATTVAVAMLHKAVLVFYTPPESYEAPLTDKYLKWIAERQAGTSGEFPLPERRIEMSEHVLRLLRHVRKILARRREQDRYLSVVARDLLTAMGRSTKDLQLGLDWLRQLDNEGLVEKYPREDSAREKNVRLTLLGEIL